MKFKNTVGQVAAATVVMALVTACGKQKNEDAEETTTTTTTTAKAPSTTAEEGTSNSVTTLLNSLAAAVPGNLSLTAFSTSTSASLALEDASVMAGASPTAELKERQEILQGKASSCLAASFKKAYEAPTQETCYEFDSDMVQVSSTQNGQVRTLGTKDGKNAKGEACLVAFARSQIVKIKDPLDRAQALLNAALCQANKDEKEKAKAAGKAESEVDLIPAEVGASIDLAPYLKNAMTKASRAKEVVTSIKMTRLADVSEQKLYQTVFSMSDDQGNTRTFTLNHSPKDESNEEYNGTLYFAVKPPKGKTDPTAGTGGSVDFTHYVSIGYVRSKEADGTFKMSYEARGARFTNDIDPINASGLLDYNAKADFTVATSDQKYGAYKKKDGTYYAQANEAANGFNYIAVANKEDADGELAEQTISYWMNPGSNYTENARGMVFSAKPDATTGLMAGCAVSGSASVDMGSGTSIRRFLNEGSTNTNITLSPKGFYHPFINTQNPGASSTGTGTYKYSVTQGQMTMEWAALQATGTDAVDFVTKQVAALMTSQCFKQNSTSGLYEIDAAKTTGVDGYDVIKTSDTAKLITPPAPPKPTIETAGPPPGATFKPADGVPPAN